MQTAELLRKVRRLEIRSRHLVADLFAGNAESVFKGRGIEFDEVRRYVPGDEVRDIDWNVTARFGEPFVKRFAEERELTVMLVVDVSRSMRFGTTGAEKRELAAELCAVLAFAAQRHSDRVGLLLVSPQVEHFVPPARGRSHVLRLLRDVLGAEAQAGAPGTRAAARFLLRTAPRHSVVFWISDFADPLEPGDWRGGTTSRPSCCATRGTSRCRRWAGSSSRTWRRAGGRCSTRGAPRCASATGATRSATWA
jgi:uncharacterized protein (DUF58 family)